MLYPSNYVQMTVVPMDTDIVMEIKVAKKVVRYLNTHM